MKRLLSVLCSAALLLSAFTGCAGSGNSGSSGSAASGNPSASTGKTTITIMQSKTEIQGDLQKVVDDYNSTQSDTTVKLLGTSGDNYPTVLQSQFSASPDKAPTIFTISGPDAAKFNRFMAPLDSSKAAGLLRDEFKSDVTVDGKLCGLPMAVEGYGFIYNKDLFKKAGVDATSLTSMDTFVDACKKLKSVSGVAAPIAFSKENYFIFIHFFNWGPAVSSNYKDQIQQLDAGKTKLNEIPSVAQWAKDLDAIKPYTNKAVDSYDDQVSGFANGKYAMIHQGDWVQTMLDQDKVSFSYGLMPYPTGGNTKLAVGLANAWRVNKMASDQQQQAAIRFLDWLLTSEKGQSYCADTFKFIPACKGMKSPAAGLGKDVADYVQKDQTVPWVFNTAFPNGIDVDGAALMQKYYAGAINSSQLLDQLTQAWVQDAAKK